VTERGDHAQLLSLNGAYARLWQLQQRDATGATSTISRD
jgi:ABC-type multidrug transport system fused ATPase/permease subunit